jgi:hypothetical protein
MWINKYNKGYGSSIKQYTRFNTGYCIKMVLHLINGTVYALVPPSHNDASCIKALKQKVPPRRDSSPVLHQVNFLWLQS